MNKTVNINIGGLFFHIDEDAYQKLSRYFDAIKRSLSNSSGKDEIMKDIEMRVAELFTERQKSDKHVINNVDVDQVVTVMGQPEDYRIDDDSTGPTATNFTSSKTKKLYRDKDRGLIAGVCTGLGHYFGIESVWIKIIFILLVWAGGTGIIAYLILWVATPKAITTSEKLEMTGEPVTISNIEKKVREEFENVSEKIKNADYDKMGNQIKSGAETAGTKISSAFTSVFGAFAKVLGAFIVIFSSLSLLGVSIMSIVAMFSASMPENKVVEFINNSPIGLETPVWVQGILFFLVMGIPLFFLLILGLKLLVTNLKSIGNIAKYSLLAIWIIAIGILISLGISEMNQLAYSGKTVQKELVNVPATDTLNVKFAYNDFFSKNIYDRDDIRIAQDSAGNTVIYSNNVSLHLKRTDKATPYIQIEKKAQGKSFTEANERAQKIKYNFKIVGNQLILDNYFLTDSKNKLRGQRVEVYLYLPNGIVYYPNENVNSYLSGDNADFDYYYGPEGYKYKVNNTELKCLNCPDEDNENNDEFETEDINVIDDNDSTKTISVKVNGKEVIQTTTGKDEEGSLTINKDGIIIKTK